jgi:hypothetical protein
MQWHPPESDPRSELTFNGTQMVFEPAKLPRDAACGRTLRRLFYQLTPELYWRF